MAQVELKNLSKKYGKVTAVQNMDLIIPHNQFLVLVGPSGCGKSTTLRMIAGLEEITGGEIFINDERVNDKDPKDRNVSMVFQNYALYPHMSVEENLGFSLKIAKVKSEEIEKRVNEAVNILGLEDLRSRKPSQLSGGQRQRVAMGRAIVRRPDAFLFDEPLSNLDAKLRTQMRTEIKKLHQKFVDGTIPVIFLINKIDLSTQNDVDLTVQTIQEIYLKSEVFAISALKNFNIDTVLKRLIDLVPLSPPYFPKDQFTDKPERFFVNEILRQKIFMYYDKEIPYSVEVQTIEFIEKPSIIKLRCNIIVERESQKGIIIGHKGIALKKIGSKARKDLEVFFKKKIFIEIKVKVSKNWRSSDIQLRKFGYK